RTPNENELMDSVHIPSAAMIEVECQRLGHQLGWRFLTCPERNVDAADIALITINPGGSEYENPQWSVETGSAYVVERWKNCAPGTEKLQKQVRRMFELMETNPDEVLSGYLVPFRSPNWATLLRKADSIRFGIGAWRAIFRCTKMTTLIGFGK